MKRILLLGACLVALAACGGDSALPTPTGKGTIRMINAVPGSPPIRFLIEEQFMAVANYKETAVPGNRFAEVDDFNYTFNFEIAEPGQSAPTRIGSQALKVEKDREHFFLLSGNVTSPTIMVWDGDIREFNEADTVLQARFSHGSTTLGDIDIYFDPAGTVPGTNPPAATLAFGEITDPADFEAGDFVLTVTAAGDVNTVYFTSRDTGLLEQFAHVITVFDADENDTGTVAVRTITSVGNPLTFGDITNPPAVRFVHASFETGAVDIYDDDQLTSLVYANLPFGSATPDLDSVTESRTYYFTPAGSTAQILFEDQLPALAPATYSNVFLAGQATSQVGVRLVPDRASIATSAKLSIYHGAANYALFNAYLVEPGTEVTEDIGAIMINVAFLGLSPVVELLEGDYDLYLVRTGTRDPISPAFPITLTNGGVTELIAVDTADPAVIELIDVTPN